MTTSFRIVSVLLLLALTAAYGIAQVASPVEAAPVAQAPDVLPDISQVKGPGGLPLAAIITLAATLVTAGVKWAFDRFGKQIPGPFIPLVVAASTFVLDWLSHLTFNTEQSWWIAAGAALAAVGLNQVKRQASAAVTSKAVGDSPL